MKARAIIGWALRLMVGGCFVWAASLKLRDPVALFTAVESYRVVDAGTARWVSLGLPWLELWVGVGLWLPWTRRGSAWIIGALLLGFMALHTSAWCRGLDVNCGCFGATSGPAGYGVLLVRNGLLLAGVMVLMYQDRAARRKGRLVV